MRANALTLCLLVLLAACGARSAAAAPLELQATVDCRGPELRLAELVAEGDLGELGELGERVVARSPAPGRSRDLARHRLARLLADWGWRGRLIGPERIVLRTPGVELDTARLRAAVTARLDEELAAAGLRRDGELAGLPASLRLSSRRVRWDLELLSGRPARAAAARLRVEDGQGFETSLRLDYRCTRPLRVAVAGRELPRQAVLADWRFEERDGLRLDGEPLGDADLAGAVATRRIAAGEVLTRANSRPAPLVRAGREVEVRLRRGAVTVTLRGVARGDGALGELVTVKHEDTRALRRYRVAGPGIVVPAYIDTGEES